MRRPRVSASGLPSWGGGAARRDWIGMTYFITLFLGENFSRGGIVQRVEKPRFPVAGVMQCRPAKSRWAEVVWEPCGVLPDTGGAARRLVEEAGMTQWLHPGFALVIHRDEAEGYYLNVSAPHPRVFVL